MGRKRSAGDVPELAAGNGLLDRRALLFAGASLSSAGAIAARPALGAAELSLEPWMTEPGAPAKVQMPNRDGFVPFSRQK
jgi:hypothetical protein